MEHPPDLDPIRKSHREASSFNEAWWKHGERLSWFQRIGYAVFSLAFLAFGLFFLSITASNLRDWDLLGAAGWSIPTFLTLVPGAIGLRNVLRFQSN